MIAITVSSHGDIEWKVTTTQVGRERHTKYVKRHDPSLAAAEAMQFARGLDSYCIFAPREVLSCIPESLRSK